MRVLVTGGTGYLGSVICRHLSEAGYSVSALCRNVHESFSTCLPAVNCIVGDIREADTITRLFVEPFDSIIHTVSLDHRQSEKVSIEELQNVNLSPVWELLENASKKAGHTRFIYLSTQQVTGNLPYHVIDEQYDCRPLNKYGLTHAIGEHLCAYFNNRPNLTCFALRLSNGYGAPVFNSSNWDWLVINDIVGTAYKKKAIVLNSDGTVLRDFIHVEDIARVISHFLRMDVKNAVPIYNISSACPVSLLEIAHMVAKVYAVRYDQQLPVYHSKSILSEVAPLPVPNMQVIDNSKLLSTGFSFSVLPEQGIDNLFSYFESL